MSNSRDRTIESSGNVFADLGLPDAGDMLLKSQVALAIGDLMKERGLTQEAAARIMDVKQPDVSNLLRGRFRNFSLERLLRCLRALGGDVDIKISTRAAVEEPRREGRLRVRVA
ncbi:MAG TPA: helix-turn-helix transcriptional regulator [Beijerinckiaceae bacterium]|nr:helix-turn-helix transcriptional regulator [Beijerinckiaceae bacterium]